MSQKRLLLGLLAAAWLVVDLALGLAIRLESDRNLALIILFLGAVFAQQAAIAGWVPLGDGRVLVRLTTALAGATLLVAIIALSDSHGMNEAMIGMAVTFQLMVMGTLAVARLLGYQCLVPEQSAPDARVQFTILQIMLLTAAAALVMGVARNLRWAIPGKDVTEFVSIMITLSAMASIVWLAVMRLPLWLGLATAAVVAPLLGTVAWWLEGKEFFAWLGFTSVTAAGLCVNLIVLRVLGYRLAGAGRW
jgi:hypothetical protein